MTTNINIAVTRPDYGPAGEAAGNFIGGGALGEENFNVKDVDMASLDQESMMAAVLSRRADNLAFGATIQMKAIQWRNELSAKINEKIAELQKQRADLELTPRVDLNAKFDSTIAPDVTLQNMEILANMSITQRQGYQWKQDENGACYWAWRAAGGVHFSELQAIANNQNIYMNGELLHFTNEQRAAAKYFVDNPSEWAEVETARCGARDSDDWASLDLDMADFRETAQAADAVRAAEAERVAEAARASQAAEAARVAEAQEIDQQLDKNISQLKSQIDTLNGTNNTEVIRLQTLMQKANEALEQISTIYKKQADTRGKIEQNMG